MRVLLVHGMGRTALSLYRLARHLRGDGHDTRLVGYVAAVESFSDIVRRIQARLAEVAALREPYAVVGHSLGGLLVRAALSRGDFERPPEHLIMLGTPNRPPRLARRLGSLRLYRWVNGECGQVLAQAGFFENSDLRRCPIRSLREPGAGPGEVVPSPTRRTTESWRSARPW